jgi:hypothetical protein
MRAYGADAAVPTRFFTLKGEAAYSTSDTPGTDDYVLYVVQLERLSGEWQLAAGYAGNLRARPRPDAVDRGPRRLHDRFQLHRRLRRGGAAERPGRVHQNRALAARGQHWRGTITGVIIAGRRDDFLGQYNRNSHITGGLRYSF